VCCVCGVCVFFIILKDLVLVVHAFDAPYTLVSSSTSSSSTSSSSNSRAAVANSKQ